VIVKSIVAGYTRTAAGLNAAIERRGLTVFGRIDHAAGAASVGMDIPPEEVFIFGNPQARGPGR
jgi:uncharacterized protein (DUF302 family)